MSETRTEVVGPLVVLARESEEHSRGGLAGYFVSSLLGKRAPLSRQ